MIQLLNTNYVLGAILSIRIYGSRLHKPAVYNLVKMPKAIK